MKITKQQRITIAKKKIRGLELTEEEKAIDKQLCGWMDDLPEPQPKTKQIRPRRKHYTPLEKAEYAVNKRAESLENPRWMQKFISWKDKRNPIGKRRVAYVRYLTMTKGMSLRQAKYEAVKYIH